MYIDKYKVLTENVYFVEIDFDTKKKRNYVPLFDSTERIINGDIE